MPDVCVCVRVVQPSLCYTAPELVNSASGNLFSAADVFSLGEPPLSNHVVDSSTHTQALFGIGSCCILNCKARVTLDSLNSVY